jgi:hypothetical protein
MRKQFVITAFGLGVFTHSLRADNLTRRYSFSIFRILLPRTKTWAAQPSQTTRYPRVRSPCHISGRSEDVTVPCAPFAWESPRLELILSMRAVPCSGCQTQMSEVFWYGQRQLIFQMIRENPTGAAPRFHGELLMLGLDISERTISLDKRAPRYGEAQPMEPPLESLFWI